MCQNECFSDSFEMCVQEMKDIEKGLLLLLERVEKGKMWILLVRREEKFL